MHTTMDIRDEAWPRELAHRRSCDIDVRLMWDPQTDRLTVEVFDCADASSLVVAVGSRSPMEVFRHPYAYAVPSEPTCTPIAA
jgi:hypothetical protein